MPVKTIIMVGRFVVVRFRWINFHSCGKIIHTFFLLESVAHVSTVCVRSRQSSMVFERTG
jgi:hypothetical protein